MPLNEIIAFRLRSDHLENDLSDFIVSKNRHEKTTGVPLDNDLLITLITQKSYIKSRHLVVPSRNESPVDMDIGALKGRRGYTGKGKGMYKGKGKGFGFKGKGMSKGQRFQKKERRKRNERKRTRTRMFYLW